ncbi:MAG: IPT/TIG domain-containing protein [Mycobacteriales bacterium]
MNGGPASRGGQPPADPSSGATSPPPAAGTSPPSPSPSSPTGYPAAGPEVDSVSPAQGPLTGGTSVTITGRDLAGVTSVSFGTTPAERFQVDSNTTIAAISPAVSHPGPVPIVVYNQRNQGGFDGCWQQPGCPGAFTYLAAPTVTGVDPSQGPTTGGTSVTVYGSGFTPGTTVYFGSTMGQSVDVINSGKLTVASPAGAIGTVDVEAVTAGGRSSANSSDQFSYY